MLADDVRRAVPEQALDGIRQEREAALGVGREHDVRRVLDEEPVALLRLAELALEAEPLGDVAGDAVDADQLAVLDLAQDVDLELARCARPVEEVHADGVDRRRIGEDRLVAGGRRGLPARRDALEERAPQAALQIPAEHRGCPIRKERVAALGIGREDHVGRRRREVAVAILGRSQVALEPVALAHVADRPVRPGERARVVQAGERDELGGDRRTVAMLQVEPAADLLAAAAGGRRSSRSRRRPATIRGRARRSAGRSALRVGSRSAARPRPTGTSGGRPRPSTR